MTPKRPILQDRDIAQMTINTKTKRLYLELHFVTVELDYNTGRVFAAQLLDGLERIAPDGPAPPNENIGPDARFSGIVSASDWDE